MVGFVEVSETAGLKYGMGSGVSLSDTRPVVSNLAVDPRVRRFGIGTALMDACEDIVKNWNFDEIILQVGFLCILDCYQRTLFSVLIVSSEFKYAWCIIRVNIAIPHEGNSNKGARGGGVAWL